MKTKIPSSLLAFALLFILAALLTAQAQGPLTPPGAPTPTMKTLDQIEARTLIGSLPFTISNSGSYYLSRNLSALSDQGGIVINASDVTLDLNGFTLFGALGAAGSHGITIGGVFKNVTVRNGSLNDWKGRGVSAGSPTADCRFIDLRIRNSGAEGLVGGVRATVERCTVLDGGATGISAAANSVVKDCLSSSNDGSGISVGDNSTVANCTASNNQGPNGTAGISVGNRCVVTHCVASDNTGTNMRGIYSSAFFGCTISHCLVAGNTGTGIFAFDAISISGGEAIVNDCTALSNGGGGIAVGPGSVVKASTARKNGSSGISASGKSTVADCSAIENNAEGFFVASGTIRNCTANLNKGDGIRITSNTAVHENTCTNNGNDGDGAGIHAISDANRLEGNSVTGNDRGLDVDGIENLIIRNNAVSNGANYSAIGAGNTVGPVVGVQDPITNTNPWANFSF